MEKSWESNFRYPCACLQSWVSGLSQKTSSCLCIRMSNMNEYEFVAGRCSIHLQQRDAGSSWRPRRNARYRAEECNKSAREWFSSSMTKVEFCWRYFPKLAVKLPEILCCGSFNGVKLQNEIFHEPGTSPDQPLAPTHPIICHLSSCWLERFVASALWRNPIHLSSAPMLPGQANSHASPWRRQRQEDWIYGCNPGGTLMARQTEATPTQPQWRH